MVGLISCVIAVGTACNFTATVSTVGSVSLVVCALSLGEASGVSDSSC